MSGFWEGVTIWALAILFLLVLGLGLTYVSTTYSFITKSGILIRNISSMEDCEKIRKFIPVQGICIKRKI